MKHLLLSITTCALLANAAQAAPDQTFENPAFGPVIVQQINIDAINFINKGSFSFGGIPYVPFETFDTLNYTNYGSIITSPGWRFDLNSTSTGKRSWSANFVNLNLGNVTSLDSYNGASSPLGNPCVISVVDPSYLWIFATNIITQAGVPTGGASLEVGPNGEIRLEGRNVNLSRSGLEVIPVWTETFGTTVTGNPPTSFVPDIAVFDEYWAQASYNPNSGLNTAGLWNGTTATAPGIPATPAGPSAPTAAPTLSVFNPTADSFVQSQFMTVTLTNFVPVTNVFNDLTNGCSVTNIGVQEVDVNVTVRSNVVKGAVFVGVPAGFDIPQIGFSGSPQPNNPFSTASVLISTTLPNAVTGQLEPAYIEVQDTLASDTRIRGTIPNESGCGTVTSRPPNYTVDRLPLLTGSSGNNGYPLPGFFISSESQPLAPTDIGLDSVTNATVIAGDYAGYGAYFDNLVSRIPSVPGGTISNTPGRVVINANNLDLTQTRIRGEGLVKISTPHLISSTNAVIDAENLSFNLSSTNGTLRVRSLTPSSGVVSRLTGPVRMWSATWDNSVVVTLTNNYILTNVPVSSPCDTNNPPAILGTNTLVLGVTNVQVTVAVRYQILIVDATGLSTTVPVNVYDLTTHSPNVVVDDNMTLVQSLFIDGKSFTLNGSITIPGALPPNPLTGIVPSANPLYNWTGINAPNLLYFTNNGALSIFNEAHFGDDRASGYARFMNSGALGAGSIGIVSDFIQNSGNISSTYGTIFRTRTGIFDNGNSASGGGTTFAAESVKFNQYQLISADVLNLLVTNNLSDAGDGSGNVFQMGNGFNLPKKPITGDLLGTTLNDVAPTVPSIQINHVWAGEDRGGSPAGYTNNAAIGVLRLASQSPNPLFRFMGAGAQNALYVDMLDMSSLSDYSNQVQIANNMVIYFAAANLGFTPPPDTNGIAQSPEEYLDGQFGGRLRWVNSFAGPNSSQAVIIGGQSVQVNSALRNSLRIDSNNDGTANGLQAEPFATASVDIAVNGNGSVTPYSSGSVTLLYGNVYSLTAEPAPGAVFTGWTGSIESSSPVLVFTNTGDLQFTANFSFQLAAGTYNGLFYQSDGVQLFQSGYFTAKTTKDGAYSGSVTMGKEKFPFSGEVDESGFSVPNAALAMELQFTSNSITGTVGDGETWTADLQADRAIYGKANKAPFAGRYTIVFRSSGEVANTSLPFGDGYGTVSVDDSGKIKFSGSLADGTKVSQTATISGTSLWPLYVPLYKGAGQILGWMDFDSGAAEDVGGLYSWIKEPDDAAKLYPDGFNFTTNATGSSFDSSKTPVTGFVAGMVSLGGGNLTNGIINNFLISQENKITDTSGTNKLKLSINSSQGLFKGSMVNPETGKSVKFNGVLLQKQGGGSGYFLGTDQSGKVIISP